MSDDGTDSQQDEMDSLEADLYQVLAPSQEDGADGSVVGAGETLELPVELGSFRLEASIGRGGMGTVYRGRHIETDVEVAVKLIQQAVRDDARKKFHREVQAHARLVHPGIVYLFEYGQVSDRQASAVDDALVSGSPFVAMELADGGTVRERMPLESWEAVRDILVQVLDALAFAHARRVIHRDLKPENLLVFEREGGSRFKLADFGIAHAFGGESERNTETLGSASGTPYYMAPEQIHGRWRQYGPWTDLYALGCIAWELVCGHPPFRGESAFSIANKHQREQRPPLEPRFRVPDELEGWIHRMMAVEPRRRFRRAADALWSLPSEFERGDQPVDSGEPGANRGDESEVAIGEATTETLASRRETQTMVVSPTVSLGEMHESNWSETLSDTVAAAPSEDDHHGERADRVLTRTHPPMPADWSPEQTDPLPAPLVGAGLGLFGLREPPFVNRQTEGDQIWESLYRVVETESAEMVFISGEAGTGKSRLAEWMATRAHELGTATVLRAVHTPGGGATEGLRGAFERHLRTVKMDRGDMFEHLVETLSVLGDDRQRSERDARALTEYLRPTDDGEEIDGPRYRFSGARQRRALIARLLDRLAERRPVVLWLDDLQWGTEAIGVLEHLDQMAGERPAVLALATMRSDVISEKHRLRARLETLEESGWSTRLELAPLSEAHQRELLDGLLPLEAEFADYLAERTEGHPLFAMQLLGHWIEGGDLEVGAEGFRVPEGREVELPGDIHQLWMSRIDRLLEGFSDDTRSEVVIGLELAAALGREVGTVELRAVLADADIALPTGLVDRLVERGLAERTTEGWAFAHGMLVESLARRARDADRWRDHHRRCARILESTVSGEEPGLRERVAEHWIEAGELERALEPLLDEIELSSRRGEDDVRQRLLERRSELLDELRVPDRDPRRLEQQIESAQMIRNRGEIQRAKSILQEVWEALAADNTRLQSRAAELLADLEMSTGDLEAALQWGNRGLEASRRAGVERLQGRCHWRISWIYFSEGNLTEAETHAESAIDYAEQADDQYGKLAALRLRAGVREARGESGAGELFESVRREAADAGYVVTEAQALNALGEHTRFAGRLEEARRYYRGFLQKMRELSRPRAESMAELNLAQVEMRAGNPEAGRQHLEAARDRYRVAGAKQGLVHLLELTHAAGTRDGARFEQLWSSLEEGWPEDWRLIKDHPWLLETAGKYARKVGWERTAEQVWKLARELWTRLGDQEAAAKLDELLSDLTR